MSFDELRHVDSQVYQSPGRLQTFYRYVSQLVPFKPQLPEPPCVLEGICRYCLDLIGAQVSGEEYVMDLLYWAKLLYWISRSVH